MRASPSSRGHVALATKSGFCPAAGWKQRRPSYKTLNLANNLQELDPHSPPEPPDRTASLDLGLGRLAAEGPAEPCCSWALDLPNWGAVNVCCLKCTCGDVAQQRQETNRCNNLGDCGFQTLLFRGPLHLRGLKKLALFFPPSKFFWLG